MNTLKRRVTVGFCGVAVAAAACGGGSSSTSTSAKPSRGFTGTTAPSKPGATPVVVNCPADNLENALNDAQPGSTIEVHGTCTGHFTINVNDLVVAGRLGRADALDGGDSGSVLTVNAGVSATLNDIWIQHGSTPTGTSGGGIANHGILTLNGGRVTHNTAGGGGGGIYNDGTVHLKGSGVLNNTANGGDGGGIWNKGSANVLNSAVSGNQADANGGGIRNDGTLTLGGSGVNANTASGGGGLSNTGTLTVGGASSVGNNQPDNCEFSGNNVPPRGLCLPPRK